jgi:hypothetical protein
MRAGFTLEEEIMEILTRLAQYVSVKTKNRVLNMPQIAKA